jgi:hypothetical protein
MQMASLPFVSIRFSSLKIVSPCFYSRTPCHVEARRAKTDGLWTLFIHFDANIRTHHSAHGTAGALFFRIVQNHILVPLIVDALFLMDQPVGANLDTKGAAFAFVLVDLDGWHEQYRYRFMVNNS